MTDVQSRIVKALETLRGGNKKGLRSMGLSHSFINRRRSFLTGSMLSAGGLSESGLLNSMSSANQDSESLFPGDMDPLSVTSPHNM